MSSVERRKEVRLFVPLQKNSNNSLNFNFNLILIPIDRSFPQNLMQMLMTMSDDEPEVGEHDQSEDVDKVQPLPERCHHYKSLQINVIVISIFFIIILIDLSTLTKVSCGTSCTRSRAQVPLTYRSLSVKSTPNDHKNCALLTI